jgi:hypothetical protein
MCTIRRLAGMTILSGLLFHLNAGAQKRVTLAVDPAAPRKQISPLIYGTNDYYPFAKAMRLGGNRLTSYNWENNASNAGHDWVQHSDDWLPWHFGVPDSNYNKPASTILHYHNQALSQGAYSMITLPMAGYVAKDKNGTVSEQDAAPSARWVKVETRKNAAFSLQPDLNDNTIYVDEELNFLLNKFGKSNTATGIKAYSLDNEPCLWSSSHQRLWGNRTDGTTVNNLMDKSIGLAAMIKSMDAGAEIYGPALYGFTAYQNLQFATDWDSIRGTGNYQYFLEYYLARMRQEEQARGTRLLDVLDLHWYPEGNADYGNVSPFNNRNDRNSVAARLQMTRSLWDETYHENTWIGREHYDGILPLVPKLKGIINNRYPGTKLALTEYSYMGTGHISGAIAQADALGIFGQQDLYLATYWGGVEGYIKSGFDVFKNYDGNGGSFGETGITATSDDRTNASVYASIHGNDLSKLHTIAINKNQDSAVIATVAVAGIHQYNSARVWILDYKSTELRQPKDIRVISNNSFEYTLPPMTIAHFVLTDEDLSVYPYFDTVVASGNVGYSDGLAQLAVSATVLDGDLNLKSVTIDLSPLGGNAMTPMTRQGDDFSITLNIDSTVASGLKMLTMTALDSAGNSIKETISYRVIKKMSPAIIWDGDQVATGEGHTFYDPYDTHGNEVYINKVATGGNRAPGAMAMHFAHDPNQWNLFAWRFDANPAGARDIREYGFIEFSIKSNAPKDADLEISLRDASENMFVSNTVLLKAQGYISSFSNTQYTKVRIPVSVLSNGSDIDLSKIWQLNISCNRAAIPFDVWIDDVIAAPYTNTSVQPVFTQATMTPDAGYADGQTLVTITAKVTDPDNNITEVSADLSAMDLTNDQKLTLFNGEYTASFKVPASVAYGMKNVKLTVVDADHNQSDSMLAFNVHPQTVSEVLWDGDSVAGGFFETVNTMTSYAVEDTGGHKGPRVMRLHLEHSWQDPFSAVLLDWNSGSNDTRKADFTTKRYLTFYLKTTAVSPDFDLMLILKDHAAWEARTIWLKQEGYVDSFGSEYQLVKVPVSEILRGAEVDAEHMTRIGFLSVRSVGGTDVFVDDITLEGSPVANIDMTATDANCGANGTISVDNREAGSSTPYSYYINGTPNAAGLHNPVFTGLATGSYDIRVKNDNGFVFMETVTVGGTDAIPIANTTDAAGSIDISVSGGSGTYSYAWSNGMTTEDVVNLPTGVYTVEVTDVVTGCNTARTFDITNAGLELQLFPNPASTYINITMMVTQVVTGNATLQVTDRFGNRIHTRTIAAVSGTERVELGTLMPGIYYVTVTIDGKSYNKSFSIN